MKSQSCGERLKDFWQSRDISCNVGAGQTALSKFEVHYDIQLPEDMRDYFLAVNGMPAGTTDEELIRFWTIEETKPLNEAAPGYAQQSYLFSPETTFVFADYSFWAHAYGIQLTCTGTGSGQVYVIGGDCPILQFQSFSELVDAYIRDSRLMFPDN